MPIFSELAVLVLGRGHYGQITNTFKTHFILKHSVTLGFMQTDLVLYYIKE